MSFLGEFEKLSKFGLVELCEALKVNVIFRRVRKIAKIWTGRIMRGSESKCDF